MERLAAQDRRKSCTDIPAVMLDWIAEEKKEGVLLSRQVKIADAQQQGDNSTIRLVNYSATSLILSSRLKGNDVRWRSYSSLHLLNSLLVLFPFTVTVPWDFNYES